MTETDRNETNVTDSVMSGLSTTESEMGEPAEDKAESDEVHAEEPTVSQSASTGRGSAGLVTALLLAFVVGLLIGYVARPFTDQLAAGDPIEPIAQNEATATNEPAPDDSASQEANDAQPTAQAKTDDGGDEKIGNEAPMLITPTPDRSGVIAALIQQNVRHFVGDEDAPVTLIEFSDFL